MASSAQIHATGSTARIRHLAPELIDKLFAEMGSLPALFNFATSTRFIYNCFENRKSAILFRSLKLQLGPVIADTMFLQRFPAMEFRYDVYSSRMTYWDLLHDQGATYRQMLRQGSEVYAKSTPCLPEIVRLCRTYSEMDTLAHMFISWQLGWFDKKQDAASAPPSRTEYLRIIRAFYRRQIMSNAFLPTKRREHFDDNDIIALNNTVENGDHHLGLFASFEPWEFQQIEHVDRFVKRLSVSIFNEPCDYSSGLSPTDSISSMVAEAGDSGNPTYAELYANSNHLVQYLRNDQAALEFALQTLPSLWEIRGRGGGLERVVPPAFRQYSLYCLHFGWQHFQFQCLPDPARRTVLCEPEPGPAEQSAEARVTFVADAVDEVPFGWVDGLDGQYESAFAEGFLEIGLRIKGEAGGPKSIFRATQLYRDAGFTLWDQRRIQSFQAMEEFKGLRNGWIVK